MAKASALEPEDWLYLHNWGKALIVFAGKLDDEEERQRSLRLTAVETLAQAIDRRPESGSTWLRHGEALADLGWDQDEPELSRGYLVKASESLAKAVELSSPAELCPRAPRQRSEESGGGNAARR